ncbi:MAG: BatA domain-containing protein [Acidobacteria bacterium]|nr:BatA domain-containing protein [Acidobacteriota bacterium]
MSFLNPLFLLGLAAVAIPIIVHLVRRTRAKKIEFPSLMFVRQVPQRTIRRKRLINLLLLILRCLALLCLVLAFARPFFSGSSAAEATGRASATIIMLDNSFSMRYGTRFEQAKSKARAIVNEAGNNDQLALASFGQGYEVLSRFTNDKGKLNSLIDSLQPGLVATAYTQALRGAEELMKEATTKDRRIVLISDYQAAGWNQADTSYRLSNDIKFVTNDVGESDARNLAITEVNAQPVIYQQKYADKLAARIANFSDEAQDNVQVEFQLNDHTVEKRQVKIAARETAVVEFTDFNLNEGVNRGQIEISDTTFPVDNRFYFTLHREAQSQALIVESANRGRSESLFLRNALTTGENLPFALTVKTPASVNPGDLPGYKVIILNDVDSLNPSLADQLKSFVEKGGGLIIAAGRHVDAAGFNESFKQITPATIGEPVQPKGDYVTLSDIKTDHPVFEVFRQSGRFAAARVFGYRRATPNEKASVLARFEDGTPALLETSFGQGKVLLFTSTLDSSWNDLPLTPLYLPLVRQMTRYLGERDRQSWHLVGQTFTASQAKDGAVPAVDSPSNNRITERNQTASGDLIVNARENGFYRLRYATATDFAAVDLDGKEADLTKLNLDDFVGAVTGADPKSDTVAAAQGKLTKEEREAKQRVWWPLLIAALLLFVTEGVLARRTKMAKVLG